MRSARQDVPPFGETSVLHLVSNCCPIRTALSIANSKLQLSCMRVSVFAHLVLPERCLYRYESPSCAVLAIPVPGILPSFHSLTASPSLRYPESCNSDIAVVSVNQAIGPTYCHILDNNIAEENLKASYAWKHVCTYYKRRCEEFHDFGEPCFLY